MSDLYLNFEHPTLRGVTNIAKIMDPAQISPQIAQFIELAIDYTQNFLGASDVAMGDARPDNTSAKQLWHCAVEAA